MIPLSQWILILKEAQKWWENWNQLSGRCNWSESVNKRSQLLFFLPHLWLLGQGLNLSWGCKLGHSCDNTRSFNLLGQARDQICTSTAIWAAAFGFLMHCATVRTTSVTECKLDHSLLQSQYIKGQASVGKKGTLFRKAGNLERWWTSVQRPNPKILLNHDKL